MPDTILRQWHTLSVIPRAPRKVSTSMVRDRLSERGFDVDLRTIQRDLSKLACTFPLECDDRSKPFGWSWSRGAATFDIPGMDIHAAVTFHLTERFLENLLPATSRAFLGPHFERARQLLAELGDRRTPGWPAKIDAIPPGLPLMSPHEDSLIVEAAHVALLEDRRLAVTYRRRGETEIRSYEVNPLGLIYRDAVGYLVCTLWEYKDVRQLVLHRIVSAELLPGRRAPRPGFDLKAYIASGAFDVLLGDTPLAVVAHIDAAVHPTLQATPIAADQQLVALPDGRFELRATLADTNQLRAWLRGMGRLVEVIEPPALRAEIAAEALATSRLYT